MDYNDILMHHYSSSDFLCHHGILGQKWGIRRFQNPDGTLTAAGRKRYLKSDGSLTKAGKKEYDKIQKEFYEELENDPNGQALDKKIRELIATNSEIKNMSENWDGDGFEFIEAVKEAETLSPKDRDELLDLDRKTNDAVWAMNNKLDERIAKLYGKWQPEHGSKSSADKKRNGEDILKAFSKDRDAYGLVTGDTKNLDSLPVMQKLNRMVAKDVQTYEETMDSMNKIRSDAYNTPDYDKYVIKAADYDYDNSPYAKDGWTRESHREWYLYDDGDQGAYDSIHFYFEDHPDLKKKYQSLEKKYQETREKAENTVSEYLKENVEFGSEKDSKQVNYWVLRILETKLESNKKKNSKG